MKAILAILLSFILIQSQAFALRLSYPSSSIAVAGTYAGALYPQNSGIENGNGAIGDNSLGVFAFGAPQSGLASGVAVYFSNGLTYLGTIVGVIDPDKLVLHADVKLQANTTRLTIGVGGVGTIGGGGVGTIGGGGVGTRTIETIPAGFANGSLKADVVNPTASGKFNSVRLNGQADLQSQTVDPVTGATGPFVALVLVVDGFKQSFTTAGTVDLSILTNTQPGQ